MVFILSAVFGLVACASTGPAPANISPQISPSPTATPAPELPGTTAVAMIAYLEETDFRSRWELWPGQGEKYMTSGGHNVLLTTYVNPPAYAAVAGKKGVMPSNAIIVKDNFSIEGELLGTTIMYKVEGYYPEHNDWYWLKVLPDGTSGPEGTPDGCVVCHAEVRSNDYVWVGGRTSLSE